MHRAVAIVALWLAAAGHAQTIVWDKYDPMAVRTGRTADVAIEVLTSGTVSGMRLDYANGGSLSLTQSVPGFWIASVPAAKVLDGYTADDVNHNFVGFIRLLASDGTTLATYNSFIQVLDDGVPSVTIRNLGGNARATTRILNLYRPGLDPNQVDAAAREFYGYFHDDYDFLQVVFVEPSYPANRYHFGVRNDVDGIGETKFNQAVQYGSAGKLQGITVYPVDFFFDPGETSFSHELGHQWVLFLKNSVLQPGPHWPLSTMAHGVMGFNIPGSSVGGDFPYDVTAVTATTARLTDAPVTKEFSDFDLYLMGLLPPSAVAPGIVVQGNPCSGCILPSSTITINDVIAVNGPRVPDAAAAKKLFDVAVLVISRDRLLTDDEMAVLEYFAARGEATTSLSYTSGFSRGTTKPFYVATRGLARVDLRLDHPPRRRAARH
ncbi:MAG TPA: hypothetical protein VLC46_26435 [Thermoanaerobaculia bacterium]|jgi:hypothetical protein|nr:hypothetical protein [Thermoanaerobaculia bacterium]